MGLFDIFKKTQTIQDDFFGSLRYTTFRDATKNYFEGRGNFEPIGDEIEYFISADLNGPTIDQRDFYKKIEDLYGEIIVKITPLIEEEFKNWKQDFKIKDFKKEFKVVALTVPRLNSLPITWNISFETIHDDNHQVMIDFKDFEPCEILIDG